jgi:hypothetical protein
VRRIMPILFAAFAVAAVPCAAGAKPHGYIGGGREPSISDWRSGPLPAAERVEESSGAPPTARRDPPAISSGLVVTAEGLEQTDGPSSPRDPAGPGGPARPGGPALPAR